MLAHAYEHDLLGMH